MSQQLALIGFKEQYVPDINIVTNDNTGISEESYLDNVVEINRYLEQMDNEDEVHFNDNENLIDCIEVDNNYLGTKKITDKSTDAFTPNEVRLMLEELLKPSKYYINSLRNYLYIVLSVNTARRAGDIVSLKVGDVLQISSNGISVGEYINLHEQKTKKYAHVKINSFAKSALQYYFRELGKYNQLHGNCKLKMSDWLFPKCFTPDEPNTVDGMRKVIQRLTKKLHSKNPQMFCKHYGTHSLRKTIARNVVDHTTDVKELQITSEFLGHSSQKITAAYINIQQKEIDDFVEKYGVGLEV